MQELETLISDLKIKRSKQEYDLKRHDDPRYPEFYAIMARLAIYDMIIPRLEYILEKIKGL